jgi:hypothetical protein
MLLILSKFVFPLAAGPDFANRLLVTIDNVSLNANAFRSFEVDHPIHLETILPVLALLRKRDIRIHNAHADINSQKPNYSYLKPSVFCGPQDFKMLLEDPTNQELQNRFTPDDFRTTRRMYFVLNSANNQTLGWTLLIIDFAEKCMYVFHSRAAFGDENIVVKLHSQEEALLYTMPQIVEKVNEFLLVTMGAERRGLVWGFRYSIPCLRFDYPLVTDHNNDGIAIFTILYLLVNQMSVVFKNEDLNVLRNTWAHWLLSEKLPK